MNQKSHITAQGELEHQAHLFVMQTFLFQNITVSTKYTQKSHLTAHGELDNQEHMFVMHPSTFKTARFRLNSLKNSPISSG